jgi:diguanylate cyclase (GGDEF)-like protein/PAS domain S-box-containing protein
MHPAPSRIDPLALLQGIAHVQSVFIEGQNLNEALASLLYDLLAITQSAMGFIGDVRSGTGGVPELVMTAFAGIDASSNEDQKALFQPTCGTVFSNPATIFGRALHAAQPSIASAAEIESANRHLPPGHPPLHSFMALPIVTEGHLIALAGLANRAGGYSEQDVLDLAPLILMTAQLVLAGSNALERRLLEARLQNERDLFLSGPVVLFRWRNEAGWPVDYVSPNIQEILGYTVDALRSQALAFSDLIHPDDLTRVRSEVARVRDGSLVLEHQPYRLRHAAGHYLWVLDHTSIERAPSGSVISYHGYLFDITTRVAAEKRQAIWASVFLNAHEGILVTDGDANILEINQAFNAMTGYAIEELLGRNPRLLSSGEQPPVFYERMWAELNEAGTWRGELVNKKKDGVRYLQETAISAVRDERGRVLNYIGLMHDVTSRREAEQRLHRVAYFDVLTGLPNRSLLEDRLNQAIAQAHRNNSSLAVCFLDLDGFKGVNDRHGHALGDLLLAQVAERLLGNVRSGDSVARLGGDEFVLLLSGLSTVEELDIALRRILVCLSTPFNGCPGGVQIAGSVGVTLYPKDGADPDTLLRHADQALYAAKEAGRNRYHLFDTLQDQQAHAYRDALERLRQALENGEFRLHYQPKVDMRLGRPVGAEALIRWQHPERGLLYPADFLDVIDDSDLSIPLGEWVIETALIQLDAWQALGLTLPVSVNITARQLQEPDFIPHLRAALERHPNLPFQCLEIEILESAVLSDIGKVARVIEAGQQMGVSFALDDFGTGFSSLAYLRRLPADTLKIDQSFVRDMLDDPSDTAIVESVIGLASSFRRHLVAEGVETIQHGLMLMRMGCDSAQGYAIARPMPPAALVDWWRTWRVPAEWQADAAWYFAIDDMPLISAEVDHRNWARKLIVHLTDVSPNPALPSLDSGQCRFGRWLADAGLRRHGARRAYAGLVAAHESVHALARKLVALHELDPRFAAKGVERLSRAQDILIEALHALQAEAARQRDHSEKT